MDTAQSLKTKKLKRKKRNTAVKFLADYDGACQAGNDERSHNEVLLWATKAFLVYIICHFCSHFTLLFSILFSQFVFLSPPPSSSLLSPSPPSSSLPAASVLWQLCVSGAWAAANLCRVGESCFGSPRGGKKAQFSIYDGMDGWIDKPN